jgi:hypothetical protein
MHASGWPFAIACGAASVTPTTPHGNQFPGFYTSVNVDQVVGASLIRCDVPHAQTGPRSDVRRYVIILPMKFIPLGFVGDVIAHACIWFVFITIAKVSIRVGRDGLRTIVEIRAMSRGLCPYCHYDVRSSGKHCPECGNDISNVR